MRMPSETGIPANSVLCPIQRPLEQHIKTLVVDDTRELLNAICGLLEQQDEIQIVGTAENGAEALDAVQKLNPDLVVMDINMPIMNGLDAAARLRERLPGLRIALMSGNDGPETHESSRMCGADVFLWKGHITRDLPLRIKELFPFTKPHCPRGECLSAADQEVDVYEFHNQHYDYYRDLLEYAQGAGSKPLARSAARMLLFHLRQMFCSLPAEKRQLLKQELATETR